MAPFTLIAGNDDYLVTREARARWATLSEGLDEGFGMEVLDGSVNTADEAAEIVDRALQAAATLPMFGDRKAVWLKDINFLAGTVLGRAKATAEALEKLSDGLAKLNPQETSVLLSATPVDRRSKAWKRLQKAGEVDFLEGGPEGLAGARLAEEEAARLGVHLSAEARDMLLAKIHGNTRLAVEEVRKLSTYAGGEGTAIGPELVTSLVPAFGEGDFFETAELFFQRDLPGTLEALKRHFFAGHDGRPVLSNLLNRNRLCIQLRVLVDAGALPPHARGINAAALKRAAGQYGEAFGGSGEKSGLNVFTQNPWYLQRLHDAAMSYPLKRLIEHQRAFVAGFTELIDRPREQEAVMREMVIRCLG